MMNKKSYDTATKSVHSGTFIDNEIKGVNTPIHTSTAINYMDGNLRYPRLMNMPNTDALCKKIADLESTEKVLVFSSGMAAITTAFLSALKPGDHFLIQKDIYGGTFKLISHFLKDFNISYDFFENSDVSATQKLLKANTKLIYIESISNPKTRISNIKEVARFAKKNNLISLIDNTFASPILCAPATFGIDVVLESGTKYMNGHSDMMLGSIACSAAFYEKCFSRAVVLGAVVDAVSAYQLERSMKTMNLRVIQQSKNALELAQLMANEDLFQNVFYPGLPSHPEHHLAKKFLKNGFGGIIAFDLNEKINPKEFLNKLKLIAPASSLGGVESTINSPIQTSHRDFSITQRLEAGITEHTLRLSVGIESVNDLIEDLIGACR